MRIAVQDPVENLRTDDDRLVLRLRQAYERAAAQSIECLGRESRIEHLVGEDRERRVEVLRRRDEAHRSFLAADAAADAGSQKLQRIRKLIAGFGVSAFGQHRRCQRSDSTFSNRLKLIRATEKSDRERHERKAVTL